MRIRPTLGYAFCAFKKNTFALSKKHGWSYVGAPLLSAEIVAGRTFLMATPPDNETITDCIEISHSLHITQKNQRIPQIN